MDALWQDLRYAARNLLRSRGFALVAVLTLALGIGANTAIFSVVNAFLYFKQPFPNPDHVVVVQEVGPASPWYSVSVPNFEDYRAAQRSFDALSLWIAQSVNLTGLDRPDRVIGSFVSANFFEMLGVRPLEGRAFAPGEDRPGAAPVVIVSHAAWQTRFGGDPALLGKRISLNGEPYTVIGILPPQFAFSLADSDVWMTISHYPNYRVDRASRSQLVLGRVKSEVTLTQAAADLNAVAQNLAKAYPVENAGIHIQLATLRDVETREIRPALFILLGAVAVVLLIACANIANLLLARGAARSRELAIRAALGAGRIRIVAQLLAESLLLAFLGGALGLLVAVWLVALLPHFSPVSLPAVLTPQPDLRVLGFTLAASLAAGLLSVLPAALQLSRGNPASALAAGRGAGTTLHRSRVRGTFVTAQIALSIVLLVAAGLFVKSFQALLRVDPGFDRRDLLTMEYRVPRNRYPDRAVQWNFHRQVVEQVRQVPGVVSAALVQGLPFSGNGGRAKFIPPSSASLRPGEEPAALSNLVTPEYFSTMGIPVLRGRICAEGDREDSPAVVIINQSLARKYWPGGENPLGKELQFPNADMVAGAAAASFSAQIIGVVGDVRQYQLREEHQPQVYFCYAQKSGIFATLVARTAVAPLSLGDAVRAAVWKVDREQPVWKIRTIEFLIERDIAPDRFLMFLMSGFGALALLLTALGTYGVISYAVAQRMQEFGVRIALGATPARLFSLVLRHGLKLTLVGAAFGIAGAFAGGRLIRGLLYGVSPADPLTLGAVTLLLAVVALLACYVPARRATRVDPLVALRYE